MRAVTVLILHRPAAADAGPLERLLAQARVAIAGRHARRFAAAGAAAVRIVDEETPESFGARLRRLVADIPAEGGIVVMGSGALALATPGDLRDLVAAAGGERGARANNRFSADAIAVAPAGILRGVPDLPGDNALPRWLQEVAGVAVSDRRSRWRLGVDVDAPADLLLPGAAAAAGLARLPGVLAGAGERLAAVRSVMADRRAEVLVAGRTSAVTIAALERGAAARFRVLVEERGMRAASRLAQDHTGSGRQGRPPRSVLGVVLDAAGPEALGSLVAGLADAAVIDTRVLLAHRLGADEHAWPTAEDRFASDLLLPDDIADPWLRELTRSAAAAPIPVALGAHTLVGPGLRLLVGKTAAGPARRST